MKAPRSAFRFACRFTFAVAVSAALAGTVGCSAQADDAEDDTPMTEDALRRQSEDLFKPTSAPVQSVPSTLKGLDHWDVYLGQTGTTVIGMSKSKKRKAIFVQLLDRTRGEQMVGFRGTGYLVASDFRLDSQDKSNELRLLAEAIRKDLTPALDAVPVASEAPAPLVEGPLVTTEPTPAPTPPAASATPITPAATAPQAGAPPAPAAAKQQAPTPCVKSTIKLVLFGLSLVRDVVDVVVNVANCQDEKAACASAVTSFSHAVWTSSTYKDLTCTR